MSEMRKLVAVVSLSVAALFAFSASLFAQNTSGSITGVVQDSTGAVIPGATVTLINQDQGQTARTTITNEAGIYLFSALPAATYTVTAELQGFKTYTTKDNKLFVNDKMGVPPIVLEVGAQGESVTVEAGAPADAVSGTTTFNGQRATQNNFTVDGQTVTDSGVNQQFAYRISMDAIAEFKVSTTSQSAEFGRNSGAQVQVASKSGTSEFHGGGYWFKRHEGWNANSFTNNQSGTPRQVYRFLTTGYDVGGPAIKDKMFFFLSHEWGRQKTPPAPRFVTVPTALERAGDFSQSKDGGGVPVTIKDPNTGQLSYNYVSQVASELPSFDQLYRVDYNINPKWRAYVRIIDSKQTQNNPYGRADSANNLALNPLYAPTFGWTVSANLATVISPTTTNEFQFGKAKNGIPGDAPPKDSLYYRSNAKITIPLLYPNADPSGLIPNFGFGGVTNAAQYTTFAGLPYYNANPITNVTDNLSKVVGRHTLKFGGFVEYAIKHESPFRPYNSTILFDRDSLNPGDTNWAFSNALLGNFANYSQFSKTLIEDAP